MAYLTAEEIEHSLPFNALYRMMVYHDPSFWQGLDDHSLPNPVRLKFDVNIRTNMPSRIRNAKGIYMFSLEPDYILQSNVMSKQLLYVGRVREGGTGYNFFRRFSKYVGAIGNKTVAKNVMRLTNLWPDHTYVYYFDLSGKTDDEIVYIENNIINTIIPPLNEALEGRARKTRQLY